MHVETLETVLLGMTIYTLPKAQIAVFKMKKSSSQGFNQIFLFYRHFFRKNDLGTTGANKP